MIQKLPGLIIGVCLGMTSYSLTTAAADNPPSTLNRDVLISSDETKITVDEVMLYLEWLAINRDATIEDLSGQRGPELCRR